MPARSTLNKGAHSTARALGIYDGSRNGRQTTERRLPARPAAETQQQTERRPTATAQAQTHGTAPGRTARTPSICMARRMPPAEEGGMEARKSAAAFPSGPALAGVHSLMWS